MAGGRVAVDTSVAIPFLRGDRGILGRFEDSGQILLSFAVRGELIFGALRSGNPPKSMEGLRTFLAKCTSIETNDAVVMKYAEIKTDLASRGKLIPDNDLWIAACALAESVPLASRDRHFSSIDGLEVLDW